MHLPQKQQPQRRAPVSGDEPSRTLGFPGAGNAPGISEFSLSSLASMPDDLRIRIDRENRTTAVTLIYNHDSAALYSTDLEDRRSRPTVPIPRNLKSVTDAAAPSNLARQRDRSASPCSRSRCADRRERERGRPVVPIPRFVTLMSDGAKEEPRMASPARPKGPSSPVKQASTGEQPRTPERVRGKDPQPAGTAQAEASDDTPVKTEQEALELKKAQERLHPFKHRVKIRNLTRHTTFYGPTASLRALSAPPDFLRPRRAYLYVHLVGKDGEEKRKQIWMFDGPRRSCLSPSTSGGSGTRGGGGEDGKGWQVVYPGQEHPDLEGYFLHVRDDGTPNWVKEKSIQKYAGGRKGRRRMAARSM